MSAKEIFDKAVGLSTDEQLLIPCHDIRQQESMRVSLAHQRRYFLSQSNVNFDIVVNKITRDGNPFLLLSKKPRIDTGIVISADGQLKTVSLKATPVSNLAREALEISRIRAAMLEDGHTEEEIDRFLDTGEITSKIDTCLPPLKEEDCA